MKSPTKKPRESLAIFAKYGLGQNFLIDPKIKLKIVAAIDPKITDTIIEIGPGHGEITRDLVKRVGGVIAIEKDKELALELESLGLSNLEILTGDALRVIPELVKSRALKTGDYKVVGNIPYYITGHLLRIFSELPTLPASIVVMVQKEVALRLVAKPPNTSLLAAATQIWAGVEILGHVSRKSFIPQPKVDSAIIRIVPKHVDLSPEELVDYYKNIKIIFKQPRKTVFNNLKVKIEDKKGITTALGALGIKENARPQDLSIEKIVKLGKLLKSWAPKYH